jgi:uncharacterized Zn finger protein (UPF0148 family)
MSWDELKTILDENRRLCEEEKMAPLTLCPECSYPLQENSKTGQKGCPVCGWAGYR